MKLCFLCAVSILLANGAATYGQTWNWLSGADSLNCPGYYSEHGIPGTDALPSARAYASSWLGSDGLLYLFGGETEEMHFLVGWETRNDLWRYNPPNNEWTWLSGADTTKQKGIYGAQGTPSESTGPGARLRATSWSGKNVLYLFGGMGHGKDRRRSALNDLWSYDINTGQWTWISGADTVDQRGIYGELGTAAGTNIPGARCSAASWTDSDGNLYLFGGYGFCTDTSRTPSLLNDLWKFELASGTWTWLCGSNTYDQPGVYGTLGEEHPQNIPGSRYMAQSWAGEDGHFYLFGGNGRDENRFWGYLEDFWKYNPATNQWTHLAGRTIADYDGWNPRHGAMGTFSDQVYPGSRWLAVSAVDTRNRMFIFGGSIGIGDVYNDLFVHDPQRGTNQWMWASGYDKAGFPTIYADHGPLGDNRTPGGRCASVSWCDGVNLYVFGGWGRDSVFTPFPDLNDNFGFLNDLWAADLSSIVSVPGIQSLPATPTLHQNYPNPFNPSTEIDYEIDRPATVRLDVFSSYGELVTTLVDNRQQPGIYKASFDASGLPSGVYSAVLRVTDTETQHVRTIMMTLMK